MNISIDNQAFYVTAALAVILLAISIFIKPKMLIYIAMIPVWIGVIYLSGSMGLDYAQFIQATAGIVVIYAIVGIWRVRKGNEIG